MCKLRSVGVTPDNKILSDLSALVGGAQGILCLAMNQLLQEGPFFDPVFTPEWQELLMLLRRGNSHVLPAGASKDEVWSFAVPCGSSNITCHGKTIWDTYVEPYYEKYHGYVINQLFNYMEKRLSGNSVTILKSEFSQNLAALA